MTHTTRFLLFALAFLLLAACGGQRVEPTLPAPTVTPSAPGTQPTPAAPDRVPAFESPLPVVGAPVDSVDAASAGEAALQIAAQALAVLPEAVTISEIAAVDWPDASLGCPQPGYAYAQVITPGYKVTVLAAGETHQVHLDANGLGMLCQPVAP